LEVLIGFGIFATALLFAFGVFPNSQRAINGARNQTIANSIARENLNLELSKSPAAVVTTPFVPVDRFVVSNGVPITLHFEERIIVDVLSPSPHPPLNVSNIRSIVRWNEGPLQKEVFYETWITN
jgi:hypothetical protein